MKPSTTVLFTAEVKPDPAKGKPPSENFYPTRPISELVGSSCYRAIADDALKDEDNAGWLIELDAATRQEWIERISWIRVIDRLAEQELLYSGEPRFQRFLEEWDELLATGELPEECIFFDILSRIHAVWFDPMPQTAAIQAWDDYVRAIARYHTADLVIHTLEDYEQMLVALGGSLFQVLPFLSDHQRQAAQHFGILDQFYNHLRDLREDAEQGVCYLPTEVLQRFGVERDQMLQQTACQNPGYQEMMTFWVEEYLPQLRAKASPLLESDQLHPSWKILRDWSDYRYRRIELSFRQCEFDYRQFSDLYWKQVQAELPLLLKQVGSQYLAGQQSPGSSFTINNLYSQLRGWHTAIGYASRPAPRPLASVS
jgi:15-cis-phytoene synthase